MKIILTPSRTIPHPSIPGMLSMEYLRVEVEADRIYHDGRLNGYNFLIKESEVERLQAMQDAGEFDNFSRYQHFYKKSHPELRIPSMKRGQEASIISTPSGFRCGPVVDRPKQGKR